MDHLRETFSRVYDQHVAKIYRFIVVKVSSQQIAEDLCSEVFMRGWEAFLRNREIQNPNAFLYQIARNVLAEHYRKEQKLEVISVEDVLQVPNDQIDPQEQAAMDSDIEEIQAAIRALKEEYQNFILLRYVEELSTPEIAQIMGKSEESVRVGMHRALKALRDQLQKPAVKIEQQLGLGEVEAVK